MKSEIEAKFLSVDIEAIREKLRGLGAVCEVPMRLMRRVTIDSPELKAKDAFVRVRDEGEKTTMTYKQFDELSLSGAKEIEIEVSDFEHAVALLAMAGLPHGSFQESRRENWRLGDVELMIDEWPWLNPYLEIEAATERDVKRVAQQLGFNWGDAVFGDVMAAYRIQYPHLSDRDTVGNLAEVKFGKPLPDLFKSV